MKLNPILTFKRYLIQILGLIIKILNKITITKQHNISLYDFFHLFYISIRSESLSIRASSLTFKLFMSLFPALVFVFSLIPFFFQKNFYQQEIMDIIANLMPYHAFKTFEKLIYDFLFKPKIGFTSVLFFLTIFYSVSNMNSLIKTLNKSYYLKENRTLMQRTIASLALTVSFYIIIIVSIFLISINSILLEWLTPYLSKWHISLFLGLGRWLIIFFMLLLWFSLLYTIGPPINIKFKLFNTGSLFSSLFFIFFSIIFNYFIIYFTHYNKIYGMAGVAIVFFIWLYYISLIIILGLEINNTLYFLKDKNYILQKIQHKQSD